MRHSNPQEILQKTIDSAAAKTNLHISQLIVLGFLAGMFIALAGAGANMGSYFLLADPETSGMGRMVSGLIFPSGIIIVVLAGAELFTGNNLMLAAVLDKKINLTAMIKNWVIVFLSNFAGSVFVAWMVSAADLLAAGEGMLEQVTVSIAASKVSLTFGQAFLRAVLCNFLVCLAVWMAAGAESTAGKVSALFFPIWLFVTAGFEHSVANMFFIPAAMFSGAPIGIGDFFVNNLLPVTLGNIVGGSILTAGAYYFAYRGLSKVNRPN